MTNRESLLKEVFPNRHYEIVREDRMRNIYLVESGKEILIVSVGEVLQQPMLQVIRRFDKEDGLKMVLDVHSFLNFYDSSETHAIA